MKKLLLILLLLFFSQTAFAIVQNSTLKVMAVTSDGKGLGADLHLEVESGNGQIWVSADPLVGTTTQSAARTARDVAKQFSQEVLKHDYKFSIDSAASLVEGPSAGAAMTLQIISALQDKRLPSNIAVTGTIDSSGNVGPVGGVFEKATEASRLGIELFMIPRGEAIQTVRIDGQVKSINLLEYGPSELGMTIVEVNNIDDVLKYAFSDIKSIDVSQIIAEGAIPDFVPQEVPLPEHLSDMKQLVTDYIIETNVVIDEAKNSVSTAVTNDPAMINTLLDTITSAEQTMKQAEILNEQNYLYSAANFAFLAKVNAMLVKDVSTNPSLLSLDSTALDLKLNDLKKEIASLEDLLNQSIPTDYLEWHISAQQRVSYAKVNAEKLSDSQLIVIEGDPVEQAFSRLSEYEFAVAWVDVAQDFYDITKKSTKRIRPNNDFSTEMNEFLAKAEAEVETIDPQVAEDIQRRIISSRLEKQNGWHLASVFDAATAFALASAENQTAGKEINELSAILGSKISDFEKKLSGSENKYYWPELYLEHAKYFLESANYYSQSDQTARAVNSLRSGISLIMLADQLFLVSEPMYSAYSNVSPADFIPLSQFPQTKAPLFSLPDFSKILPKLQNGTLLSGFIVALLLILAVGWFFAVQLSRDKRVPRPTFELIELQGLQKKADKALFEGKISEDKHSELAFGYAMDLALMEKKQSQRQQLSSFGKSNSRLNATEKRMQNTQAQFEQGLISPQELDQAKNEIRQSLLRIQKDLKEVDNSFAQTAPKTAVQQKPFAQKPASQATTKPTATKTQQKRTGVTKGKFAFKPAKKKAQKKESAK